MSYGVSKPVITLANSLTSLLLTPPRLFVDLTVSSLGSGTTALFEHAASNTAVI